LLLSATAYPLHKEKSQKEPIVVPTEAIQQRENNNKIYQNENNNDREREWERDPKRIGNTIEAS